METEKLGHQAPHTYRRRTAVRLAGLGGFVGATVCSVTMVLGVLGLAGVAAVGASRGVDMGSMGSTSGSVAPLDAVVRFLIDWGPPILVGSIGLFLVFALATGRRAGPIVLAAAAGALLYWAMYLQSNPPVMYGSVAMGMATWAAIMRRLRRAPGGGKTT